MNNIRYNNEVRRLQTKITRLDKNKEIRLDELKNKIPQQRQAIKQKAEELYNRGREYREKGIKRKSRLFNNAGSVEIKKLDAISRYRKRKEIHFLDREIREVKDKIEALKIENKNKEIRRQKIFTEIINANLEIQDLMEKVNTLKTKIKRLEGDK